LKLSKINKVTKNKMLDDLVNKSNNSDLPNRVVIYAKVKQKNKVKVMGYYLTSDISDFAKHSNVPLKNIQKLIKETEERAQNNKYTFFQIPFLFDSEKEIGFPYLESEFGHNIKILYFGKFNNYDRCSEFLEYILESYSLLLEEKVDQVEQKNMENKGKTREKTMEEIKEKELFSETEMHNLKYPKIESEKDLKQVLTKNYIIPMIDALSNHNGKRFEKARNNFYDFLTHVGITMPLIMPIIELDEVIKDTKNNRKNKLIELYVQNIAALKFEKYGKMATIEKEIKKYKNLTF